MAWKGVDDFSVWYSTWDGPALVAVGQVIYLVWKGANNDQGIYSAIWDGVSWSVPQQVKGIGTSGRPALVVYS